MIRVKFALSRNSSNQRLHVTKNYIRIQGIINYNTTFPNTCIRIVQNNQFEFGFHQNSQRNVLNKIQLCVPI